MGDDRLGRAVQRWALPGGTVALFALHLWLSSHVPDPTVVFDENGYLGTARWLAGGATWEMPFAPFYAVGYSVVLAPFFAVVDDPAGQWMVVRLVNATLLASVFPLLVAVLRTVLDVDRPRALAAAGVASVVPAVLAAGISAIAENLVLVLVPATILAAWAALDADRHLRSRVLLGPAVAALYGTHPRFTFAIPIVAAALVLGAWRGRIDRRVAAANVGLLVVAVAAIRRLTAAAQAARWDGIERIEGSMRDWWDLATSPSGIGELALTALGQGWYLVIGSLGLSAIGVAVLARRVVGPGAADGDRAGARRLVVGATLVVAVAVFATSVVFFAQVQFRADHFVYGRHNDSFTPLWAAVAMAYLLQPGRARRAVVAMGAVVAVAAVGSLAVSTLRDPMDQSGVFSVFAVPAIARYVGNDPAGTFVRASIIATAAMVVIGGVVAVAHRPPSAGPRRRVATTALGAALAVWFAWFGYGTVTGTQVFHTLLHDGREADATIERLGIEELCIDASAVRARANLTYPWALPDVDVRSYDAAAGQEPPCAATMARLDDPARSRAGDRAVALDRRFIYEQWDAPRGLAVWVRPGPEQDRLDRLGALLPAGFPTTLPTEAHAATVAVADLQETFTVPSGGRLPLRATVHHEGTGAPWPNHAAYGLEGHVRVVAQITPLDPGGVPGARSGGELDRWMLPGDRTELDLEIVAVDQLLSPLPPGRYQVQLGIAQTGEEWFTSGGDTAAFVLEVVPDR